jgi:hypothetical protein
MISTVFRDRRHFAGNRKLNQQDRKKRTYMKTCTSRSAFFNPRVLINLLRTLAMAIGVLLLIPQAGSAQTQNPATPDYDAVRDFSIISNPNGVWSYGWMSPLGSSLNLYTVTDTTAVSGMSFWEETFATPPVVGHNDTSNTICWRTVCDPPTYLVVHPGFNNEVTVVRWTAPSSGRFRVQGAVAGLDYQYPTTTTFYEVLNSNRILFRATIDSYHSPFLFQNVLPVSAGDTVDFAVDFGQDGNWTGDSTGIQFKVTSVRSLQGDEFSVR